MNIIIKSIISILVVVSASSYAVAKNSLVLTCDFSTETYDVIIDYPEGCAKEINKKYPEGTDGFRYISSDVLFLAKPPKCPEGFIDSGIQQGGRTSSGHAHQTSSYQVRRICLSKD
jgi:hypothetical protein